MCGSAKCILAQHIRAEVERIVRPYDALEAALVPVHISARRTLSPNFGGGLQGRCDSKILEAACLDEARPYGGGMLQRTSRQLSSLGNNNPTIVQTWPR